MCSCHTLEKKSSPEKCITCFPTEKRSSIRDLEQSQGVRNPLTPALLKHSGTGFEDPPGSSEHLGELSFRLSEDNEICARVPAGKSRALRGLVWCLFACSGTSGVQGFC